MPLGCPLVVHFEAGRGGAGVKRGPKPKAKPASKIGHSSPSARLSFAELDKILRHGPPVHLRGPGGWRLPDRPVGALAVDKAFASVLAAGAFTVPAWIENGALAARGIINAALFDARDDHAMEAMWTSADEQARLFKSELEALVKPLTRVRDLSVDHLKASLALQSVPGRRIDLDEVMDAAAYLIGTAKLLPPSAFMRRKKGPTKLTFAPAFACSAAGRWRDTFGFLPPKSRPSWFSDLLAAAWRDAGLPDDWRGLTGFDDWMAERAYEGISAVAAWKSDT